MIEVCNVTKTYGKLKAVDDISFTLQKGEILGFLGPNGAGKSTTMNIITGLLLPDNGSIKIDGIDIFKYPNKAKKLLGYLPEQPPLYIDMTVYEYLSFVCELKGINKKEEIDRVLYLINIKDVENRLIKNLSKGYKQRVGIAAALIGNPQILILDEPSVGLDPKQIIEIRNIIKDLSKDHTIILSSHILPEVNEVCDKIIIINNGKIEAIDTPDNLSRSLQKNIILKVQIEGPKDDVLYTISHLDNVTNVSIDKEINKNLYEYIIETDSDKDIRRELFFTLSECKMPIFELSSINLSLEDIFLKLTIEEDIEDEVLSNN